MMMMMMMRLGTFQVRVTKFHMFPRGTPAAARGQYGPVRKNSSGVGLPVTSRTLAEMGLSETAQRDFEAFREAILNQKPQKTNGHEYFLMTFNKVSSTFRYLKETRNITISCCGTGGGVLAGTMCMSWTHFVHCFARRKKSRQLGAGILKRDGFHGNAAGLFYVHPPELVAFFLHAFYACIVGVQSAGEANPPHRQPLAGAYKEWSGGELPTGVSKQLR